MPNKTSIMLGQDGLPMDDVAHFDPTPDDLGSFERASEQMARWKAPRLLNAADPHSYLLVGLMDGTGNDAAKDPVHATNVAKFRDQLAAIANTEVGSRVRFEYIEGPGTQDGYLSNRIDSATGRTSLARAAELYDSLVNEAQRIYEADPQAKIAIHLEGFSRGASQVPLLARMIDEWGIPDPRSKQVQVDERGVATEHHARYHQAPGKTPMSVGLYDPVPTGYMELMDRRLPPSVVSGFQISSIHERRGLFPVDQILPEGLSKDGRFLNVSVAGVHSDVGGSYIRGGLGIRSFNLMTDYHNHLLGEPVLERLHEPTDPRMNVIHHSERGNVLFRTAPKVDRATPEGQIRELTPDTSRFVRPGDVVHAPATLPEALRVELRRMVDEATPVQRTPRVSEAALTEGDTLAARLTQTGHVELTPYKPPMLERPSVRIGGPLGALAVATAVSDAVHTGQRFDTLLAQDNLLGAQHELRNFAANNANAWVMAYTVGKLGAEMGSRRGVHGAIAGGIAGGVVGYVMSDKAMQGLDGREIANQVDSQGRHWHFNGRQWVKPMEADLSVSGANPAQEMTFAADLDTRRELDYKATNKSVEIGLSRLPPPRNPYSLEASPQDRPSLEPANWIRDPDNGQWHRNRVADVDANGRNIYDYQTAPPQRASELDRQAADVIQANIANGPAPIAARYQVSHRLNGWEGPEPAAVTAALNTNSLQGSNGRQYQLGADGMWRHGDEVATGNLAAELAATREALQPKLQSHTQTMAQLPQWQQPTQVQEDVASLAATYEGFGVRPNPESLAAIQVAINTTREQYGLDPATTSLALDPNAQGPRDINSPIMHLHTGNDGTIRVAAVTTAEDIELARQELRAQGLSFDTPLPDTPGQRIEAQTPQQREIQAQAVSEAQRLGATPDQVQQVAAQAVGDRQQGQPAAGQGLDVPERTSSFASPSFGGGARSNDRDEQQELSPRQSQAQSFPTDHHDYALFVAIQSQLPKDTPDEKTAEIMRQAKLGGIKRADQLDEVVVENDRALIFGKTAGSYSQEVSLSAPAPSLNETLQRNQDYDQQQALQMQQFQEQQARINQSQGGQSLSL